MKHLAAMFMLMVSLSAAADGELATVDEVLNSLHETASTASFEKYFALYDDSAVFIGTDASEVWSKKEFKAYAKPHFDKGRGWTYLPKDRNIYFSPDKNVAWFDELLDNESLGETRGTGVLVKKAGSWKITQYHLTIPIPNEIADDVAEQIKAIK
ncbi:nuclear transport factor 2 family protein [Alteromonas gracilis]|uniref:Protein with SnoaL 3 domain, NTF 2 superfamily n=1 Tax=Alteromonas gracilis TaxID=1479524 RepID=A0ABX5CIH4_9ALTE|nr:nuclear transport factor 2 family protein [Alteromonas gracilis]PRO67379.1 protein with SnoaL 3 domain, NTF 2 superfamily [Alteromonas gracilis]